MKKYTKIVMCILLVFFLGAGAGFFTGFDYSKRKIDKIAPEKRVRLKTKNYKFISPLADYEESSELMNKDVQMLKNKVRGLIDDKIKQGDVYYISVYFRDLLNGPWFGVNMEEKFDPASLLKVPLMIAYLKYEQTNPGTLDSYIKYDKEIDTVMSQNILPDTGLEAGKTYTIYELIYRMVAYSDNAAKDVLFESIDHRLVDKVYDELGVTLGADNENSSYLTVREYSSFFRVLFNASYLNAEMSEKALEILSNCSFKMGIRDGVPAGVVVANKFGERGNDTNKTFQLHDCGIVYHRYRPYVLCVMTYGRNFNEEAKAIKEISSLIYNKIDAYYNGGIKK